MGNAGYRELKYLETGSRPRPKSSKKGIYFSLEAMLAVALLFTVIVILSHTYTYSSPRTLEDKMTKDIINLLSDTRISEIDNDYIIEKIKSGEIKDTDATILEEIGKEWILGNRNQSRDLARNVTNGLLPENYEYSISIKDNETFHIIASSNATSGNDSSGYLRIISNKRIISGIEMEKPIEGITSKSILRSIENKTSVKFFYFGGFVGQGNITAAIELGDFKSIKKFMFEADISTSFSMRVNNNSCNTTAVPTGIFTPVVENQTITKHDLSDCKGFLRKDMKNNITMIFDVNSINSSYIGGGYLEIDYIEDRMYDPDKIVESEYPLPGIDGIINIYSGFYIPKNTTGIEITLDVNNSQKIFVKIANKTVYEKNTTGARETVTINDTEIRKYFDYKSFEEKTVPIRIGTRNFTNRGKTKKFGNGDAVLITDVSGSMAWRFDSQYNGVTRGCSDPNINLSSTTRVSVAKCINKDFVNSMLNDTIGNNVGLVSYSTGLSDYTDLTNNQTRLNSEINSYVASGSTCIACGIKKAIDVISDTRFLINSSSGWNYTEGYPVTTPPQRSGLNWTSVDYDDSDWSYGTAPFGFDSSASVNYSDINRTLSKNSGNYYFRKIFNLSNATIYSPKIFISSDNNAEVYINNYLIVNDTYASNAKYWNIEDNVARFLFFDGFESGTLTGWTTDSNSDGGVIRIDTDHYDGSRSLQMYGDNSANNNIWVQRSFNIASAKLPYLELYLSMEDTESNDLFYIEIYDGTWHTVYRNYDDNGKSYYYHSSRADFERINIDLTSFNRASPITVRLRSSVINNEQSDSIQIDNFAIRDFDVLKTGENIIAVKLKNSDNNSAFFDLQMNDLDNSRKKGILVMSDGNANYCYLETDSSWDCTDSEAERQAIDFACGAHKRYGISIYSVAYGMDADTATLQSIADCDNSSHFFVSSNVSGLKNIYSSIAKRMLQEMTLENTQNFDVIGAYNKSTLYPDSSIRITSGTKPKNSTYGKISTTIIEKIDPLDPIIRIPQNSEIVDAKVTSYSKQYWTSIVKVNNRIIYNISDYGKNFTGIGDPFQIQIPPGALLGVNNITIRSTDISRNTTYISRNNSIIYTILVEASTGYSDVLESNIGCTWTVEFGDRTKRNISIPKNYAGAKMCSYTNSSISYDNTDTIDSSAYGLFRNLDLFKEGRVFVNFAENDLEIYMMSIPKVPYMWGPSVMEIRIWNRNR